MQTKELSWTAELIKATGVHTCKDFYDWTNQTWNDDEYLFEDRRKDAIFESGLVEVDLRDEDQGIEVRINGIYEGTITHEELYRLADERFKNE